MKAFQIFLICFVFSNLLGHLAPKRFYSSPFLPVIWNPRVVREYYSFNDEVEGPSDYFYDNEGLLRKKAFTRSDGFMSITSFEYNPDGHLKTSERILQDGRKMLFTYTYDDADHLINRVSSVDDSITSNEIYQYDASGRLIKAIYLNVDGWLTGELEFVHSVENQLKEGTYIGKDGLQAKIHFTYNRAGLTKEIRWIFTNGKFQVYSFSYDRIN